MSEFFDLKNRVALVTGASRGIGAAIAMRLAKANAIVVGNYRSNKAEADKVLAELKKHSPQSMMLQFDVGEASQIEEAYKKIADEFGRLEILVCNAGISADSLIMRSKIEDFERTLKVNLQGGFQLIRAASKMMIKQRYGRIVCVSSVIGEMGNKGQAAYAASKAGIFGLVKSVAAELGTRNITCNAIAPGFIETEMTASLSEETAKQYLEGVALGRLGSPEEVAAGVHFLVAPGADYITGATLDVNGGLYMR